MGDDIFGLQLSINIDINSCHLPNVGEQQIKYSWLVGIQHASIQRDFPKSQSMLGKPKHFNDFCINAIHCKCWHISEDKLTHSLLSYLFLQLFQEYTYNVVKNKTPNIYFIAI